MTVAIETRATDELREIPIEELVASLNNPRRTMAGLEDLTASIRESGITTPLLVRPVRRVSVEFEDGSYEETPYQLREKCSELLRREGVLKTDVDDCYEIVAGHRRFEAAMTIGLKVVPCIVREMGDETAAEIALTENVQRVDISAIEQALAFGKLLAAPGATVESVAAAIGMSAGYVSRRLKLLDAIEAVRDALNHGAIEVGHALELARLSVHQQQELLYWLDIGYHIPTAGEEDEDDLDDDYDDEGICKYCEIEHDDLIEAGRAWSNEKETVCDSPDCKAKAAAEAAMGGFRPTRQTVAELRKRIASRELRILGEAPFPLEDEIPPIACTECPKRSSNARGLFDDILRDACTDPDCYETKLKVWVKAELEKAELVMLYDGHAQDKLGVAKWNVVVGAECASQEPAIWVSGRLIGRRTTICRDKKCATHGQDAPAPAKASGSKGGASKPTPPKLSAEEKAKVEAQKAEREKLLKKVEAEKAYRERLWRELAAANVPDAAELPLIKQACVVVAMQGGRLVALALGMPGDAFDYSKREASISRVAALPYKTLLRAAALTSVVTEVGASEWTVSQGQKPKRLEEMAELLGLDVAAIRSGKPTKNPTSKAPAKKAPANKAAKPEAPKPAKKTVLDAATKKRIAAAQRARWAVNAKAAKKGGK